jgi:hypothetical protein
MVGAVRLQQPPPPPPAVAAPQGPGQEMVLRFEDLTIDDELPPLERLSRYVCSSIALQRLVHVKMLSETSVAVGDELTISQILPLLPPLVADTESIIRQHVAMQLLPLAFACMGYSPPAEMTEEPQSNVHPRFQHPTTNIAPHYNRYRYCYKAVIDHILPHLSKLISDPDGDVRQASAVSISGLVLHQIIRTEDIPSLILRIPLQLIHSGTISSTNINTISSAAAAKQQQDKNADMRMTGAALLGDLCASLTPDHITKFVIPHLMNLAKDPAMKVRRVVAGHSISKATLNAAPHDITLKLFPTFARLANDEQKYVRRACCEAIVEISKVIPSDLRNSELIPLWKRLERDPIKPVKYGALQKLGQLIATFASAESSSTSVTNNKTTTNATTKSNVEAVNELLPYFTGMAFTETNEVQEDASNRLHCAFSFPAVVLTVGGAGWGKLRDAFFHLSRGPEAETVGGKPNPNNAALKRCLACSIHEISKIVGSTITESELVPIYEKFLKDPTEQVRFCALRNFHLFVQAGVTDPRIRETLLTHISDMLATASPMNWRIRDCIATQLIPLMELFDSHSVRNKITPLVFKLLDDPVSEVREKTCFSIPHLFQKMFWLHLCQTELGPSSHFATEQDARKWSSMANQEVLRVLRALPYMDDFSHRQTYCYICLCFAMATSETTTSTKSTSSISSTKSSLSDEAHKQDMDHYLKYILLKELMPLALSLKDDKVSNVRCLLRKCIRSMPKDIRGLSDVAKTLKVLDLEEELWEDVSNRKAKLAPRSSATSCSRSIASDAGGTISSSSSKQQEVITDAVPEVVDIGKEAAVGAPPPPPELTIIHEESPSSYDLEGTTNLPADNSNNVIETLDLLVSDEKAALAAESNEKAKVEEKRELNGFGREHTSKEKDDDDDKSVSSKRSVSSWLSSSSRKSKSSQGSKGKLKMFRKKKAGNQIDSPLVAAIPSLPEDALESVNQEKNTTAAANMSEHKVEPALSPTQIKDDDVTEGEVVEHQYTEIESTHSLSEEKCSIADNDDWSLSAASSITSSAALSITVETTDVVDSSEKKQSPQEDDDNNSVVSSSSRSVSSWLSSTSLGKVIGLKEKEKSASKKRGKYDKRRASAEYINSQEISDKRHVDGEGNACDSATSSWIPLQHSSQNSCKSNASDSTEKRQMDSEKSDEGRGGRVLSTRIVASSVLPSSPKRTKETVKGVRSDTIVVLPQLESVNQSQEDVEMIKNVDKISGTAVSSTSRVLALHTALGVPKPTAQVEEEDLASLASI